MTVSAIYILGPTGKVIISRDYRGDVTEAAVDRYVLLSFSPDRQIRCDASRKGRHRAEARHHRGRYDLHLREGVISAWLLISRAGTCFCWPFQSET